MTEKKDYIVEGIYQALRNLYDFTSKVKRTFFFEEKGLPLGNGYNGAVIAYKLPAAAHNRKRDFLEKKNPRIKLFEFSDLKESNALKIFLKDHLNLIIWTGKLIEYTSLMQDVVAL